MSVIVYSNPNCVQCDMTKKWLTTKEIPFESKLISESPEVYDLIEAKGYKSAPVVVAGDKSWAGFKLDNLSSLL